MKELLQTIQNRLTIKFAGIIEQTDKDPDKWYELMVVHEDESTETVASADTFTDTFAFVADYFKQYRFDRLNIDIWKNRESPEPTFESGLMPVSAIYSTIYDYYRKTGDYEGLSMVGELSFNDQDKAIFLGDFVGEDFHFKNEIAFRYFFDLTCHISDSGFDDYEAGQEYHSVGSSYMDILNICKRNEKYAQVIFGQVSWQHSSTLFEEWIINNVFEEDEDE